MNIDQIPKTARFYFSYGFCFSNIAISVGSLVVSGIDARTTSKMLSDPHCAYHFLHLDKSFRPVVL
jgi:hypothetical protein